MASPRAVATSLKMFSRAFAGTIDKARAEVYFAALDDVSDEQLGAATVRLIKTHKSEFIPTPAAIRRAAGIVDQAAVVDVDSVVRQIEKLAIYSPNVGMIYPPVPAVRAALGETVAYAYAAAGGPRMFRDGDDVGENIARREFQKVLEEATRAPGAKLTVLGGPTPVPRLTSGDDEPEEA